MSDLSAYYQLAAGQPAAAILSLAAALLLIVALLFRRVRPWHSYLTKKKLLTDNERNFYFTLSRATNYPIFAQVSMGAIIDADSRLSAAKRFSIRRRFAWKIADFVICKPSSLEVLLIIELDDRTHDAGSDRKRDAITKAAGYQTVRFQSKHKPTVAELAELFSRLLPTLLSPPSQK